MCMMWLYLYGHLRFSVMENSAIDEATKQLIIRVGVIMDNGFEAPADSVLPLFSNVCLRLGLDAEKVCEIPYE